MLRAPSPAAQTALRSPGQPPLHERIRALCDTVGDPVQPAEAFRRLVGQGLDRLPLPGYGKTIERWRALAAVAAHDLSLAKLFEGHTDALAILDELHERPPEAGTRWAVWAAESPHAKTTIARLDGQHVRLAGRKAWCSGAAAVDHALVTAALATGGSVLVAIALQQPGIAIQPEVWKAVGMGPSASVDLTLDDAPGWIVGGEEEYLRRPGFWHGGAGIAACWFGAAEALGESVRERLDHRADAHARAHLGAIAVALHGAAALLREAAHAIDRDPRSDARPVALGVRAGVEAAATAVLNHAGRALGATPFCLNARFARHAADLPVFMRQSHAERDLATLGDAVLAGDAALAAL